MHEEEKVNQTDSTTTQAALEACPDCAVVEKEAWQRFNDSHRGTALLCCEKHRVAAASAVPTVTLVDREEAARQFDHAAWKGFNQSDSEFEKGYKHAMGAAAKAVRTMPPAAASLAAPSQNSSASWSKWFECLGDKASAEVVNATANLVTDERLAALVQAGVLPNAAALQDEAPLVSDADRWRHDLIAAGWTEESATAWYSPDGGLYRRPFGAWKELQRRSAPAAPTSPSAAAKEAAREIELTLNSYFTPSKAWRERVEVIIERYLLAVGPVDREYLLQLLGARPVVAGEAREIAERVVDVWRKEYWLQDGATDENTDLANAIAESLTAYANQRYREGLESASKAICDACAHADKWGEALHIEGSMRWWHTKEGQWPCSSSEIRALLKESE